MVNVSTCFLRVWEVSLANPLFWLYLYLQRCVTTRAVCIEIDNLYASFIYITLLCTFSSVISFAFCDSVALTQRLRANLQMIKRGITSPPHMLEHCRSGFKECELMTGLAEEDRGDSLRSPINPGLCNVLVIASILKIKQPLVPRRAPSVPPTRPRFAQSGVRKERVVFFLFFFF